MVRGILRLRVGKVTIHTMHLCQGLADSDDWETGISVRQLDPQFNSPSGFPGGGVTSVR